MFHYYFFFMRALFCSIDGTTSGPKSFKGEIGCAVGHSNLDDLPFCSFKKLHFTIDVPDVVITDLSSDQKQLLAFLHFISTGAHYPGLTHKLGKLCHSRWLTLAIRILALYCKSTSPSANLIKLVRYIGEVYAPSWFEIKKNIHWQNGPKNFFHQLARIRSQPNDVVLTVMPAVQRNAFFALPDNVLAGMLSDHDIDIRDSAVRKILEIRKTAVDDLELDRTLPELNWKAESYHEMINWDELTQEQLVEPAVTKSMSDEELVASISAPLIVDKFYCHTQCVERGVKQVSAAVLHSYSEMDQTGSILQGMESRQAHKNVYTKKSYDVSNLIVIILLKNLNNNLIKIASIKLLNNQITYKIELLQN